MINRLSQTDYRLCKKFDLYITNWNCYDDEKQTVASERESVSVYVYRTHIRWDCEGRLKVISVECHTLPGVLTVYMSSCVVLKTAQSWSSGTLRLEHRHALLLLAVNHCVLPSHRKASRKVNIMGVTVHQNTLPMLPWSLFSQPLYFADMASSDFQLSRYLKESLSGRAFEDDEGVIVTINEEIEEQDQHFFCEALQQRCVDLQKSCVCK